MMRSALLLAQRSYLGASSLKQQSTDIYDVKHQSINQSIYVAPLEHISLIQSQPVCSISLMQCA